MQVKLHPVIMAGGIGSRLWPLSINTKPKQFLKVDNKFSPLQQTIIRNAFFGKPTIIVNSKHKNIAQKQVAELGIECEMIIEPLAQGTAICSILASIAAKANNKDCVVLIPSDHKIQDNYAYTQTLLKAASFVEHSNVVTIGIKPTKFTPKYGYIKPGNKLDDGVYVATKFVEKPALISSNYFNTKRFMWNSGIFLYNPDKFLSAISLNHSALINSVESIWQSRDILKQNCIFLDEEKYSVIKAGSIDHEFMERMSDVVMVEGKFDWLDIGDFGTFFEVINKDLNDNYFSNNTFTNDTKNCCVIHDKKVAIIIGIQDAVVVSNKQYLLIASKEKVQDLESSIAAFNCGISLTR